MSLSKKVVLTVSGYKISLSDPLQFYKNDQLKLIFIKLINMVLIMKANRNNEQSLWGR